MIRNVTLLLSAMAFLFGFNALAVDLGVITKELTTTGVTGWIHGSVAERHVYVFTYRNPLDFFDYLEMSLVPTGGEVEKQLEKLNRNDQVLLKGSLLDIPAPQPHVLVSSVQMVTPYVSGYPADPYGHQAKIPDDLLGKTSATFLVHAVAGNGQILVVEYEDAVVPVFVKNGSLTQNLFRGDVVQLAFKLQSYPNQPVHLDVNEAAAQPLQVLDSLHAKNGKPVSLQGNLIMFPKSPEIIFNVFAVQEPLPAGLSRQYTLVNMDDPNVFNQIRTKLQKAWDSAPTRYVNGRNKLISTKIQVKATGIINDIDPSQANPQILLKSADDIQIIKSP
jgi:hypothetical protein